MKLFFTVIALVILASGLSSSAQTMLWEKTYGGSAFDEGRAVVQTPDSGFVIAGVTSSQGAGGSDLILLKTDKDGNGDWLRTYGGIYADWGLDMILTSDSNLVVVGFTASFGSSADIYIVKTDDRGFEIWQRSFGGVAGDYGYSVVETTDGGYLIAGATYSSGAGSSDALLLKVSSDGDSLWARTLGGAESDWATDICLTTDGGYIFCGYTSSFGNGNYDLWAVKVDADGNQVWSETFGSSGFDGGTAVVRDPLGNFLVAGVSDQELSDNELFLVYLTPDGILIWDFAGGESNDELITDLIPLPNLQFIAIGQTSSSQDGNDLFLALFDHFGNNLRFITHGGAADDNGWSAIVTIDENILSVGGSYSFGRQLEIHSVLFDFDFLCGDANGDGEIDVTDPVYLIEWILAGGYGPFPRQSANFDCSSEIDVADIVALIAYIFQAVEPPCDDCSYLVQ